MNINSMIMKIDNFHDYVTKSGAKRDVEEFIKAIAQPQVSQNIMSLRDIMAKVLEHLNAIKLSDVPGDLEQLLVREGIQPLNPLEHIKLLTELESDSEVDTGTYHSRLTKILNNLSGEIQTNQTELETLYNILLPFYEKDKEISEQAVISFVFKDVATISNLKKFAHTLTRWERTLRMYHELVSSESPKDVELVNIQNGSLDTLLHIDVDIAINFTEIVKYGFYAFSGYLVYKKKVKEIIETYQGNKELEDSEKEREKGLLKNIASTIKRKLEEQHKRRKGEDNNIKGTSSDTAIEHVTKVLSEHIVKGNDIKLLTKFDPEKEEEKDAHDMVEETNKHSLKARNDLRELSDGEKQLLLEYYELPDEEEKGK